MNCDHKSIKEVFPEVILSDFSPMCLLFATPGWPLERMHVWDTGYNYKPFSTECIKRPSSLRDYKMQFSTLTHSAVSHTIYSTILQ